MNKLGEQALWYRTQQYIKEYKPEMIGIAGSINKTITKQAIKLALKDTHRVRADKASYTSPIGVALRALGIKKLQKKFGWVRLLAASKTKEIAEEEPDIIILEIAADKPGDIDALVQQIQFNIAVITRVDTKNLHLFQTKEMVAHEMLSLPISIKQGIAILNADDPHQQEMKEHITTPIITYGKTEGAGIRLKRANRINGKKAGFITEIQIEGKSYEQTFPHLISRAQIQSILIALAITKAQEGNIQKALNNLRNLKPPTANMEMKSGINNATIIDDSWDATPESTMQAIETLAAIPARRKIAILGDIQNLASKAIQTHKEIGEKVAKHADILITIGTDTKHTQASALESKFEIDAHHFEKSKDVGKWLTDYIQPDDLILIKGSRAMHMEGVTKRILAK